MIKKGDLMTSFDNDIVDYVRHDLFWGLLPSTRRHCLGSAKGRAARLYTALYYGLDDDKTVEEIMKDFV